VAAARAAVGAAAGLDGMSAVWTAAWTPSWTVGAAGVAAAAVAAGWPMQRRWRRGTGSSPLPAAPRTSGLEWPEGGRGRRTPGDWRRVEEVLDRLAVRERVALAAGAGLLLVGPRLAILVLVAAAVPLVADELRQRRDRVEADRLALRHAVTAVVAALRAGMPPELGLAAAAESSLAGWTGRSSDRARSPLAEAAAAARAGMDVPDALAAASARPGMAALTKVAVCWRLAEGSGSGLADALERVSEGLRDDEELAAVLAAELATVRATGRLLATLPVLGVAGAAALGYPPQQLLLENPVGRVCLLLAMVLTGLGMLWLRWIASSPWGRAGRR